MTTPNVLTWSEMMALADEDTLTEADINRLIHTCVQLMSANRRLLHNAAHVSRALHDARHWNAGTAHHDMRTCAIADTIGTNAEP